MRNPALRALLVAAVALALVASAGGAVDGATTVPSPLHADDTVVHTAAASSVATSNSLGSSWTTRPRSANSG